MFESFEYPCPSPFDVESALSMLTRCYIHLAECGDALSKVIESDRLIAERLGNPISTRELMVDSLQLRDILQARIHVLNEVFFTQRSSYPPLLIRAQQLSQSLTFGDACPYGINDTDDQLSYTLWHNHRRVPDSSDIFPHFATPTMRRAHAAVVSHIALCRACNQYRAACYVIDLCHEGRQLHAILDQAVAAASRPSIDLEWPPS